MIPYIILLLGTKACILLLEEPSGIDYKQYMQIVYDRDDSFPTTFQ